MKIKPLITEKSLIRSKSGKYSFTVPLLATAGQISQELEGIFSVKIEKVWTLKHASEIYRSRNRKKMIKAAQKIAVVTLKEGKIDIFDSVGAPAKDEVKKKTDSRGGNKK